jgi:hypothetical protein
MAAPADAKPTPKAAPATVLPTTDPVAGLPKGACDHTAPAMLGQCKKCGVMIAQPEVAKRLPTPDELAAQAKPVGRTAAPPPPAVIPPRGGIGTPRGGK